MKMSTMQRLLSIVLACAMVLSMFPMYALADSGRPGDPVVVNSGFESALVGDAIPGWSMVTTNTISTVTQSTYQAHSGEHSLFFNNPTNTEQLQIKSDKIAVMPGETYIAKAWVYVIQQTHSLGYEFHYWTADNTKASKPTDMNLFGKGTIPLNQWTEIQYQITVPDDATQVELRFNSGMAATSTVVYIDDVSLVLPEPVAPVEPLAPVVVNPGFESALVGDAIPGWSMVTTNTISTVTQSTYQAHSGEHSLFFNNPTNTEQLQIKSDKIAVTPGENYIAKAWVYVIEQTHSLGYEFHYWTASDTKASTASTFKNFAKGTIPLNEWTEIEVEFTVPADATQVELRFNSGKAATSTVVYIDDVSLVLPELAAPPMPEHIQNAGFEAELVGGHIPNWTLGAGTAGALTLSTDRVNSGTKSLHLVDNDTVLGTRVISDGFQVIGGESYIASVYVNVVNQSHNIVYEIYYYDAAGAQVGFKQELFGTLALGTNVWTQMRMFTDAPADAVYAKAAFFSGGISNTEAYFDDVALDIIPKEQPLDREYGAAVNLGDMVSVSLGQAGAIQTNSLGENEVYFVSNGLPGTLSVLDAETGALKFSQEIPNTEATWAITIGPDQNVYFASTMNGVIYRYLPAEKRVETVGVNPSDNWVWDLEATADGKLYGGTYKDKAGGKVFEYDIATGQFRDYGVVKAGQDYVRGIGVHGDYIYAALGTNVHLYKIHRETGVKTEINIPGYTGTVNTMADAWVFGDKLFASVSTVNMVVLDLNTEEVLNQFQYSNMISEPNPANPNEIYFKYLMDFFKYDMSTNKVTPIELPFPLPDTTRVKDMSWITLTGGEKAGETVLAMVTQYGEYFLYDPADGAMEAVTLAIDPQPVRVQALKTGPMDGRLYLGGYQRGMSIYNPFEDRIDLNISSFAQPEGIGFLNDYVYYGTYVGSIMYKFDPRQEAALNVNPQFVYDITNHQDRPFAIESGGGRLYVGNVADYGILGGTLAIYNEEKDEWKQFDDVVEDQAIIGLAYKDGLLYGGTTVWGGLGSVPTQAQAKIFVWDVAAEAKIAEFTPDIPGIDESPKMIGDLSFGPDGLLWGAVDGTIFALDVETREVVKSKMIRPSVYNSSKWKPYQISWSPDGMLYTTLSRKLMVIDPETLQYKVLDDIFVNDMTIGIDGSIYYAPDAGTKLSRIAVPETDATLSDLTVDGETIAGFSPGVTKYELALSADSVITAAATQADATVAIQVDEAAKQTLVGVTGTDGKSKLVYTINWIEGGETGGGEVPKPSPTSPDEEPKDLADPTTQVVNEQDLQPNENGAIVVELEAGQNTARLPIHAGATVGEQPIIISSDAYTVEVPAEVLNQLQELATDEGLEGAQIELSFEPAEEETKQDAVRAVADDYNADIQAASEVYRFNLSVIDKNGEQSSIDQFDKPIAISLAVNGEVNEELIGIYRIDEDGALTYVGGTIADNQITVDITEAGNYVVLEFNKQFEDVTDQHWANKTIKKMAAMLIAQGVNASEFAPQRDVTRAEFVSFLARAFNLAAGADEAGQFADVDAGKWYANAVQAAFQAGIINGTSRTTFSPEDTITREQMAMMLLNAYAYQNGEQAAAAVGSGFADQSSFSGWARDAVQAAQGLGLVNGRGNNLFVPQGQLTRAESMQAILNLLRK